MSCTCISNCLYIFDKHTCIFYNYQVLIICFNKTRTMGHKRINYIIHKQRLIIP